MLSAHEKGRQIRKAEFKSALKRLAEILQPAVTTSDGQWAIKGFLDAFKNVYTITADTKIVSKILEIHLFPRLLEFAHKTDYRIILTEHQNHYPDFSFVHKDDERIRFAVDLKTTFRKGLNVNGYTLGSHGKYFQDPTSTKNVRFPYGSYWGHFCLGLIYTRSDMKIANKKPVEADLEEMAVYSVNELGSNPEAVPESKRRNVKTLLEITSVMKDLQFFACEKWEIASDQEGSGNTENIGGIKSIENILNGRGVFCKLGEKVFNEYWSNYAKITDPKTGEKITSLYDYLKFKRMDPALAFYEKKRQVGARRRRKSKR